MNNAELVPHIRKTWSYAKAMKIGEIFSGPSSLVASHEFKAISVNPEASYEEVYLLGLRESQYNILLKDFSYFQFAAADDDGVRFAYYPNPFLGASPEVVGELTEMQEYVLEGLIEIEEFLHRVSEIRKSQHPPLIRYEYSKTQYLEESHPCSHFHIGFHSENRWPARRFLTANAFSLLIFRVFYLRFWLNAERMRVGEEELALDRVLDRERANCRMLYGDEFSALEEKRFYLI